MLRTLNPIIRKGQARQGSPCPLGSTLRSASPLGKFKLLTHRTRNVRKARGSSREFEAFEALFEASSR
eukprot:4027228-Amphidinium_carterae.1